MNVIFDSWDELINALRTDYTTSLKDACKLLKSSRNWVNQYIRPHVKSIYLNNNIRGQKSIGINWVRMAAMELEKDMTESIWLHTNDLYNYIKSSITSVTKQTKSIPVTFFMSQDNISKYKSALFEFDERIYHAKNLAARSKLIYEKDNCYLKYINKNPATTELFKHQMNIGKRTEAPHTPVPLPDIPIDKWIAPHDIKEYGDSDETIYRYFFKNGFIRIEVQMSDLDNNIGRKVFYIPDPNPINDNAQSLIFTEESWKQYKRN